MDGRDPVAPNLVAGPSSQDRPAPMNRAIPLTLVDPPPRIDRSAERLAAVAGRLPAILFELRQHPDGRGELSVLSEGAGALLQLDAREATEDPARLLRQLHPEDRPRISAALERAARRRAAWRDQFRVLRAEGGATWLEVDAHPHPQPDGSTLWQGWVVDTTEQHDAQRELADSERRHRELFAANPIPMWVHDVETRRFLTVNDAALAHYGYDREEFLALTVDALQASDPDPDTTRADTAGHATAEVTLVRHRLRCGRVVEVEMSSQPLAWDGRVARLVTALDVTSRRSAEAEIQRLANYDTLTRLPNRRLLADRLRQSLASSLWTGSRGAVLIADLDDFKRVNETLGQRVGDEMLVEIAARLQRCVRPEDTVARLSADEFAVVLGRLGNDPQEAASSADACAQRIVAALGRPFAIAGLRLHASASVGIAVFGQPTDAVDDLLVHADSAMHRAKAAGPGTIRFFDPAMQVALRSRAALETDLRRALSEGQLWLAYQAQVDDRSRTVGAELLLRWQHPERGAIPPMAFIPLAEETGLIEPIGQWVLESACIRLASWARVPNLRGLRLSVNVSARQFRQADFVRSVERALAYSGAPPGNLRLELTESLLLDNINECIDKMRALKAIGVGFALDDFGTGYSSLSYLRRLPLDELKIDRSFIRDITTDANDAVIVQTIIGMANNLGLKVTAEGVETTEQMAFLGRHGCDAFQGWLFGRPIPLSEFEAALAERPPMPPPPAAAPAHPPPALAADATTPAPAAATPVR